MMSRTGAEKYFSAQRADPEYGAALASATRRVAMFDAVIRSLDLARVERGMTKADLARRADIAPAAVRRLFSERHKNPTLRVLVAIADALGIDLVVTGSVVSTETPFAERGELGAQDQPTPRLFGVSGIRRRTGESFDSRSDLQQSAPA